MCANIKEIDEEYLEQSDKSVKEVKTIDKKSMYNDTDVDYKNGDIVNINLFDNNLTCKLAFTCTR